MRPGDGTPMKLDRRAALKTLAGALAGAAGFMPMRGSGAQCPIESPRDLTFDVLLGSKKIGSHQVRFATENGILHATTHISLKVKLAFITLLDLQHESEELWQAGQLVRLDSTTREGSDKFEVHGVATGDGFRVRSEDGVVSVAASIMTTNTLWDPCILDQSEVIDAQHGGVVGIVVNRLGTDEIEVGKRSVSAAKSHFVLPSATGDLWFADVRLVKARFEVSSQVVEYQLIGDEPETMTG